MTLGVAKPRVPNACPYWDFASRYANYVLSNYLSLPGGGNQLFYLKKTRNSLRDEGRLLVHKHKALASDAVHTFCNQQTHKTRAREKKRKKRESDVHE